MYTLLIVDDDPWALQLLNKCINWRNCGFENVLNAVNGKHAMQLIDEHQPELVITDIKMDKMDGIELLALIKEKYPQIRVILLSGYPEFEYARAAIKKGAVDYLLKPVEENELVLLVKRTLKEIEEEKASQEREKKITKQLESSIPVMQEKFIQELLNGNFQDPDILQKELSSRNICMDFSSFYIMVLEVDGFSTLKKRHNAETIKDMKKTLQKDIVEVFFNKYGMSVSFFDGDQLVIGFSPRLCGDIRYISKLNEIVKNETNYTVTIGVSRLKQNITMIHEACAEAFEAIKWKLYQGTGQVISIDEYNELSMTDIFDSNKREQLSNYIHLGASEKINELISGIFQEICDKKITYDVLQMISIRIVSILNDHLEKLGYKDVLADSSMNYKIRLEDFETLENLKNRMVELFVKGIDIINGKIVRHNRKVVDDAISYINKHLHEEISLESVANKLFINPNYMGRLFKNTVGNTFTHFLMKTRVEKAKYYLKESYLKVYEISEKVGYKNDKYFAKIFKEFEGITPNEYRNNVSTLI